MNALSTDRRNLLKLGALAATPVVALAPAAALASPASPAPDDAARRLALLEDERAIKALARAFLRRFNAGDGTDCRDLVASADAICIDAKTQAITADFCADPSVAIADDGCTASFACPCHVDRVTRFSGHSTMERMARFQGQGEAQHASAAMLRAEFARAEDGGWIITRLDLA